MIEAKGLFKTYGKTVVLDNMSFTWPRRGLIGIYGPSGCGKSTLLKTLAGLLPCQGSLRVWQHDLTLMPDEERTKFRRSTIGLIFQRYRLFDNETVAWNVSLPLFISGNVEEDHRLRVQALIDLVGLKGREDDEVGKLSGGERQRVALARALIRQPRIILADEPTAALDDKTKHAIFALLKQIAAKRLVVIVSHDLALLGSVPLQLFEMKDGRLIARGSGAFHGDHSRIPLSRPSVQSTIGHLPLRFCLRHARQDAKAHRWRHLFTQGLLSIALLAIGLGVMVTTATESKMVHTVTSFIGRSGIQVRQSESPLGYLDGAYYAEQDEVTEIHDRYRDMSVAVIPCYHDDFDSLFADGQRFFISSEGPLIPLPQYRFHHVSEFVMPFEIGLTEVRLNNDEIIMGVTVDQLETIGIQLRLGGNLSNINEYLFNENVNLVATMRNEAWSYEDEQLWRIVSIAITEYPVLVHSNPSWNEWVIETSMRFPSTTKIDAVSNPPWLLHKSWALVSVDSVDLIDKMSTDFSLANRRFEYAQAKTDACPDYRSCVTNRIEVIKDPLFSLSLATISYIKRAEPYLGEAIVTTEGGYLLYPEAMFGGFAHETYFACDEPSANRMIDLVSFETEGGNLSGLPPGIARGHFEDQSDGAVRLKSWPPFGIQGSAPVSLGELAVSEGLALAVFNDRNPIGRELTIVTRFVLTNSEQGRFSEFHKQTVNITGVSDDQSLAIYGCDLWSIRYYRDIVGIPGSKLRPLLTYFEIREEDINRIATRLKKLFPKVALTFPQQEFRAELRNLTRTINAGMTVVGAIAALNAIVLAALVLVISHDEMHKDRRLVHELGGSRRHVNQLLSGRVYLLIATALFAAVVELLVVGVLIEMTLADYFMTGFVYAFPWLSIAVMIAVSFILAAILLLSTRVLTSQTGKKHQIKN